MSKNVGFCALNCFECMDSSNDRKRLTSFSRDAVNIDEPETQGFVCCFSFFLLETSFGLEQSEFWGNSLWRAGDSEGLLLVTRALTSINSRKEGDRLARAMLLGAGLGVGQTAVILLCYSSWYYGTSMESSVFEWKINAETHLQSGDLANWQIR